MGNETWVAGSDQVSSLDEATLNKEFVYTTSDTFTKAPSESSSQETITYTFDDVDETTSGFWGSDSLCFWDENRTNDGDVDLKSRASINTKCSADPFSFIVAHKRDYI